MKATPHLDLLQSQRLQLLTSLEESPFYLNAICRDRKGATVELELYIKMPSNQELIQRYEKRLQQEQYSTSAIKPKDIFSNDQHLLITYPHLDTKPLWEEVFNQRLSNEHCLEIMEALESFYLKTKENPPENFISFIPVFILSGPKPRRQLLIKSAGTGPWIEQWKFRQQITAFCAPPHKSYLEQFTYLRNKLLLQLISGSPRPLKVEVLQNSDSALSKLYPIIYADPENCTLLLVDIRAEQQASKKRKLQKRSLFITGLITLIALCLFIRSSKSSLKWLGDTFIEALEPIESTTPALATKQNIKKTQSLETQKKLIINQLRSGEIRQALKKSQFMRVDFKEPYQFEQFQNQLQAIVKSDFSDAIRIYESSLELKQFARCEQVLSNLINHYPKGDFSQQASDLLEALPLKKAQHLQEQARLTHLLDNEFPHIEAMQELAKTAIKDPLKLLKKHYKKCTEILTSLRSERIRYIIRCEQLFLKAEHLLFKELLKNQNLEAAKNFLTQQGLASKKLQKISSKGFIFTNKITISFTSFSLKKRLELMEQSLLLSEQLHYAISLLSTKHQLADKALQHKEHIVNAQLLESLEFVKNYGKIDKELKSLKAMEQE